MTIFILDSRFRGNDGNQLSVKGIEVPNDDFKIDEIGYWSEVKLDIVREYAKPYSTILSGKKLSHVYIDGFAGSGVHIAKGSGEFVPGSPLNALNIEPKFDDYYLVDLDGNRVNQLQNLIGKRPDVHVFQGDCNKVLLEEVFPCVRYDNYRRGLCLLDPYGLHLNWEVIKTAGRGKAIDLFLNFPIMDMNRNALWRRPAKVHAGGIKRMTAFWGDESWRDIAYEQEATLFGPEPAKLDNETIVEAFCNRLRQEAGFKYVVQPMPMRNSTGAVVYYLFFASQQDVALKIVKDIFAKYKDRGVQ